LDIRFQSLISNADTDASFFHKENATKEDYEKLGDVISKETGLALPLQVLGTVAV
jgi:hypothetical protein